MNDERLIELLDESLNNPQAAAALREEDPAAAAELASLLATARAVRPAADVEWPVAGERSADRRRFMAQLNQLPAPAVSHRAAWLPGWLVALWLWMKGGTTLSPKENRPMTTLVKYVFAFLATVGLTGGGVVVASTDSLPDDMLYPVKLVVEDTRLAFGDNGAGEAQLHLELAQLRIQEMEQLAAQGVVPDEAILNRLRTHLQNAARLAAGLDGAEVPGLLDQLRAQVQTQEMTAAQVGEPAAGALGEAYRLMHQFGTELENGAREPQQFQLRHGDGLVPDEWPCGDVDCEPAGEQFQYQYSPGPAAGPGAPGGNPDCPAEGCGDGIQNEYGPGPEAGPGPGAGPGAPGGNPDCPAEGCGDGIQNEYGPGPEAGPGPDAGPGAPGGNPDCPAEGCGPAGEAYEYGPGPEAGPGEPGGNPDCPAEGCGGGTNNAQPRP